MTNLPYYPTLDIPLPSLNTSIFGCRSFHRFFEVPLPYNVTYKDFMNELRGFHEQFAECFQRSESREHFFNYMAGQFSPIWNANPLNPLHSH
jgi:hypothetical protein